MCRRRGPSHTFLLSCRPRALQQLEPSWSRRPSLIACSGDGRARGRHCNEEETVGDRVGRLRAQLVARAALALQLNLAEDASALDLIPEADGVEGRVHARLDCEHAAREAGYRLRVHREQRSGKLLRRSARTGSSDEHGGLGASAARTNTRRLQRRRARRHDEARRGRRGGEHQDDRPEHPGGEANPEALCVFGVRRSAWHTLCLETPRPRARAFRRRARGRRRREAPARSA